MGLQSMLRVEVCTDEGMDRVGLKGAWPDRVVGMRHGIAQKSKCS
jgi:hypothetical protein